MDTATVTIFVVIIFALIAIFSFVVYQKRGEAEIRILGMSLKLKGSNEIQQSKPSISAKNITSREGGLLADDGTGQGIEAENINVKDDVLLTSHNTAQDSSKKTSSIEQPALNAQMMTAGGNITIQQFVGGNASLAQELAFFIKQIGLESVQERSFAKSQFEAYCNAWKSLQGLRVAGDDLWELATEENIVVFAQRLREAKTTILEGEVFFTDKDREDLLKILERFLNFRLGKARLIEIRSKGDILIFSLSSIEGIKEEISSQIKRNYEYKIQYEQLLENIRVSFKRILSSNIA